MKDQKILEEIVRKIKSDSNQGKVYSPLVGLQKTIKQLIKY